MKHKIKEIGEKVKACVGGCCEKTGKNHLAVLILIAAIAGGYFYSTRAKVSSAQENELKAKTEKFLKENMVRPGTELQITELVKDKDSGLYKMTVQLGGEKGQKIVSYVTADGAKFFPEVVNIGADGKVANANAGANDSANTNAPKTVTEAAAKQTVPSVELFVMSYCPYGLQAEKGILPVLEKLGSKIDFKLRFVSYVMHGEKEFNENLNQYCVQKEAPEKFSNYLKCFADKGDASKCFAEAGVNKAKITSCAGKTDNEFGLAKSFNDSVAKGEQTAPFGVDKNLNEKYGVQGSPTLIVNGTELRSGRDATSLLKAICSGFSEKPAECGAVLSSDEPAPGFGAGVTAGGSAGDSPSCH